MSWPAATNTAWARTATSCGTPQRSPGSRASEDTAEDEKEEDDEEDDAVSSAFAATASPE